MKRPFVLLVTVFLLGCSPAELDLTGQWMLVEDVRDGVNDMQHEYEYVGNVSIEGMTEEVVFHENGELTITFDGRNLYRDSAWYLLRGDSLHVFHKKLCLDGYCTDSIKSRVFLSGDTLILRSSEDDWSKFLSVKN